jgi:hypothetical protein
MCLVWAPRGEIVDRLVTAGDTTMMEAILVSERDSVLTDLYNELERAGQVELAGFSAAAAFAREAIAAARDGHMTAAQSLAACGLEPAVRLSFGLPHLGGVRTRFESSDVHAVRAELRKVTLLQMCTAKGLAMVPQGFNRHATQRGDRDAFSDANALAGLLLLSGWLREFRWFADHHPEAFRSTAAGGP